MDEINNLTKIERLQKKIQLIHCLSDYHHYHDENLKSFITKRVKSILVNFRYLIFKLLKYKENNKKICDTFGHNFRYIPLYIMG